MDDFSDSRTVAIKPCNACRAGMLESDRYCRRCGACQESNGVSAITMMDRAPAAPSDGERRAPHTRGLESNGSASFGRTVSGPLVSAIVAGVTSSSRVLRLSRRIRSLIVALIALPVWLIVVLLSPVDAYVALREVSTELHR